MSRIKLPKAMFDSVEFFEEQNAPESLCSACSEDFCVAKEFLIHYTGSDGTFRSYRRDIERLLHWAWLVEEKYLRDMSRGDIDLFIKFCKKPPKSWIGLKNSPRFISKDGIRMPNKEWRPFTATVSKSNRKEGLEPNKEDYEFSDTAVKATFASLSSFFNYLLVEDYISTNPVSVIRQKSKYIKKRQGPAKIRRLSNTQWNAVIEYAQVLADESPGHHERTLFMVTALYSMYLRISELVSDERWTPTMNDFQRDSDKQWWFTVVGKGNKERQIAVSDAMIKALKRWRKHLGLSPLPSPADSSPLLPKIKGVGPLSDVSHVRECVQGCFDGASQLLLTRGEHEEARSLGEATVHWLRHTGISEDVKHRPREHVRDDAGHSSGATTDLYIDIELKERYKSAKNKPI